MGGRPAYRAHNQVASQARSQAHSRVAGRARNQSHQVRDQVDNQLASLLDCEAGEYLVLATLSSTGAQECKQCVSGKYNDEKGKIGEDSCKKCPVGKFNNQKGKESCTPCNFGNYQSSVGAEECTECSDGTIALRQGLSACIPCGAGEVSNIGHTACDLCTAGTYGDSSTNNVCVACKAGTFLDKGLLNVMSAKLALSRPKRRMFALSVHPVPSATQLVPLRASLVQFQHIRIQPVPTLVLCAPRAALRT